MPEKTPDIAALVGSRICHDLTSPLGAIGNGLELLEMSGSCGGPELALIRESVESANARIRFFRVAYGRSDGGQALAQQEITAIVTGMTKGSRISIDWAPDGAQARREVRLAFLLIQCLETALPYGGEIRVERIRGTWHLTGRGEKMKIEPPVWELLITGGEGVDVTPAQVQFLMVAESARRMGRRVQTRLGEKEIGLSF